MTVHATIISLMRTLKGCLASLKAKPEGFECLYKDGVAASLGLVIMLFLFVGPVNTFAQEGDLQITGRVIDAQTSEVLPGVNVVVKGTTIGTTTDAQGKYQLTAPSPSDTLTFSFVGYTSRQVPINGRSTIDVTLSPAVDRLEQLVVVGYGEQRPQRVTGSVSSVNPADIADEPVTKVTSALQGRVSGVEIVKNGGSPASEASIRIRGTGTVNEADPLIVIDGMPVGNSSNPLNIISPQAIESIEILKDAASAAIYGNRAANGVVLITTKGGSYEKDLSVTFSASAGVTTPRKTIDVLEAPELAKLKRERYINDGLPVADIWKVDSLQVQRTNWQKELLDTGSGVTQSYSLSLNGGGKSTSYSITGNYATENGMIKKAYFDRMNLQINTNHRIENFLGVGDVNISQRTNVSRTNENDLNTLSAQDGVYWSAIRFHPGLPVKWSKNRYSSSQISGEFGDINNPIFTVREDVDENVKRDRILSNVKIDYNILDNLSIRLKGSIDYQNTVSYDFNPKITNQIRQRSRNELTRSRASDYSILTEGFLDFSDSFGQHEIGLLAGYSRQVFKFDNFVAQRRDFGSERPSMRVLSAGGPSTSAYGTRTDDGLVSGIGRLNYTFDNKYLLTASFRADASSRFPEAKRWGYFPAVSAGWRISQEDFFQDWAPVFSQFKLSGGWGVSGNQSIPRLQYLGLYSQNAQVYLGGQRLTGISLARFPNKNITWESVNSVNIALDIGLFEDQLTARLEVWRKDTEDMLLAPPSLGSSGTTNQPSVNVGAVRNQGIDFELGYERSFGDLDLQLSGNASFLQNEVLNLNSEFLASRTYGRPNVEMARTFEGHPIATFYGWKTDGLYQTQEEINNDPALANDPRRPNIKPGDVRFKDLNGDGRIDSEDRTILGSPHPDVTYGFNVNAGYRGLDLSLTFAGSVGAKIFNADRMQGLNPTYPFNLYEEALNRWTGEGTSNKIPRMTTRRTNRNFRPSDKWVEPGDYLKLKTLTLGYSPPENISSLVNLEQLRFHATIQNVFTVTPYSGRDPELGYTDGNLQRNVDFGQYPLGRTWTLGINAGF